MAFLSRKELAKLNFKKIGEGVKISDKACFYGIENIEIGDLSRIDDFVIISAGENGIKIGRNVHIACYVSLIGKGKIEINDFAGVSSRTAIYSSNDDYSGNFLTGPTIPEKFTNVIHENVNIGKHVVVGAFCLILPGVKIGDGSAIAAFSLVNSNISTSTIAGGIPAREIKVRERKIFELESDYLNE
jgi:dTDP-4-amino-4,6-dideoxy-D-glucose acyltransferase